MTDTTIHAHQVWQFDELHAKDMRALCRWGKLDYPDLPGVPRMSVLAVIGLPTSRQYYRLMAMANAATAEMEAFEYGHRN